MPREKTDLATNPIRVARNSRNRTLHEFASDIGVHYQAIYLAESGVFPFILPTIKRYLTKRLGLNGDELDRDYCEFVSKKRQQFESEYGPWSLPDPLLGDSPIVEWRRSLGLTRSALGKGICVQLTMLERVENKKMSTLPGQLVEAFKGIGFTKSLIEEMEERVEEFYYS